MGGLDGGMNGADGGMNGADGGMNGADAGQPVVSPETLMESPFLFGFGIAAGDALEDRVVLHTRYSGVDALSLRVWRMEGDTYAELVADAPVTPGDGGFCHLDVQGLTPGTKYRYAFLHGTNGRSPIGRFRAALGPMQLEPLVFGAVSCTSNSLTPTPLAAEQFTAPSVWLRCCDHLKRTIAAIGPPAPLRLLIQHANLVG